MMLRSQEKLPGWKKGRRKEPAALKDKGFSFTGGLWDRHLPRGGESVLPPLHREPGAGIHRVPGLLAPGFEENP